MHYYNEFDKKTCAWLAQLIKDGLIPAGYIDNRDIRDVKPQDLIGYDQCHFFAGIAGWPYALHLAGWPRNKQVWTGSCPCQPFSESGKQLGMSDPRDMWPAFFDLIKIAKPAIVFGEQSSKAINHGWLDRLASDFESEDYAVSATVLQGRYVGSKQKRNRLYWLADSKYDWVEIGRRMQQASENSQECERVYGLDVQSEPKETCQVVEAWSIAEFEGWEHQPEYISMDHGFPHTMELSRGYGNAIIPQVAAKFIEAYLDAR